MKIVFATNNLNKLSEIKLLLQGRIEVLSLKDIFNQPTELNFLVVIAIVSSFIFSFLTVKYFLIFINKFSMSAFVIYRILIALVLFSLIY